MPEPPCIRCGQFGGITMNCDEARQHWDLYHDSEGDAELHWTIRQHLDHCAACAEWFAKQDRFEDLLSEKLRQTTCDPELWNGILRHAGVSRPATLSRWLMFASIVTCAATLLLAVGLWWSMGSQIHTDGASLSQLSAALHERYATGQMATPLVSSSDAEVEAYLQREVSFPVRCPPRRDSGFAVRGAGTCQLANEPAAYVVGQVDEVPVSIFILSRSSLPAFPHQAEALQRESIHRCREGAQDMALSVVDGNLVLAVGKISPERLVRIVKAYGTYPHVRS